MNNHIITGPDKLLQLIKDREEISLTDATAELKVSRSMVENWSEILEEKGLIVLNVTLTEIFLTHPEIHKFKSGILHRLSRHLRSIGVKTAKLEECALRKKEQEIDARLTTINNKLIELKKFERIKSEANTSICLLRKKEKEFDEKAALLQRKEQELECKRVQMASQQKELDYARNAIRLATEANVLSQKDLAKRELVLRKKLSSMDLDSKRLTIEKTAFMKEKEALSNKIKSFSEMLKELKDHKKTLIQKENELYELAKRQQEDIVQAMRQGESA